MSLVLASRIRRAAVLRCVREMDGEARAVSRRSKPPVRLAIVGDDVLARSTRPSPRPFSFDVLNGVNSDFSIVGRDARSVVVAR